VTGYRTLAIDDDACVKILDEAEFLPMSGIATGIGVRTLLRWLKLPEFQSAYRQARRDAFGQAIARLQQGTSAAATTLLKVMIDPGAPASVRVRAADSVLNHATKAIEIEEIEARVAALEQAASGKPTR
jgi:hypothetical protein